MDLLTVRALRRDLEEELLRLIRLFEKRTGVGVCSIEMVKADVVGERDPTTSQIWIRLNL